MNLLKDSSSSDNTRLEQVFGLSFVGSTENFLSQPPDTVTTTEDEEGKA